jgi:hypothetical protein
MSNEDQPSRSSSFANKQIINKQQFLRKRSVDNSNGYMPELTDE